MTNVAPALSRVGDFVRFLELDSANSEALRQAEFVGRPIGEQDFVKGLIMVTLTELSTAESSKNSAGFDKARAAQRQKNAHPNTGVFGKPKGRRAVSPPRRRSSVVR